MLIHIDCLFFSFLFFQSLILLFGCSLELHFLQAANVNKLVQEKIEQVKMKRRGGKNPSLSLQLARTPKQQDQAVLLCVGGIT